MPNRITKHSVGGSSGGRRSERIIKLILNSKKFTGNPRDILINSDKKLSTRYLRPRKQLKLNNTLDDDLDESNLDKTDPGDKTYYPSSQDESGCSSGFSSFIDQNLSSTPDNYYSDQALVNEVNVSQNQNNDDNHKTPPIKCSTGRPSKSTIVPLDEYASQPDECSVVQLNECDIVRTDKCVTDEPDECNTAGQGKCVTSIPVEFAPIQPDQGITENPDECSTARKGECVTSLPDKFASVQPDERTAEKPDERNTARRGECVASLPDEFASVKPDEITKEKSDECNTARRGECITSLPDEFASVQPDEITTENPDECNTARRDECVTSLPDEFASVQPDERTTEKPDECNTARRGECVASIPDVCASIQPHEMTPSYPYESAVARSDCEDSLIQSGNEFNLQRYVYPNDYHYYMRLSNTDNISLLDTNVESVMNPFSNYAMHSISTQSNDEHEAAVSSEEEDSDEDKTYKPTYTHTPTSSSFTDSELEGTEHDELMRSSSRKIDINYNDKKSLETTQKEITSEEHRPTKKKPLCSDGANINTNNAAVETTYKQTKIEIEEQRHNKTGLCNYGGDSQDKKKEKRIRYRDFCFFCEQQVLNFARHVIRNHSLEPEVQKVLSAPKKSKSRKILLTKLRKKGNYILNAENCVKPMKKTTLSNGNDYLPCPACLGFYSRKQLWKHKKNCGDKNLEANVQAQAQNFLLRNLTVDHRLKREVFHRMRPDKISLEAKKDTLICAFGAQYLRKHREKHFISVTSRKMRELAKLILEIKKIKPEVKVLVDALKPQYYDIIVTAAKNVAHYDTTEDRYESPTYAMNISTSLKQCCNIALMETFKTERNIKTAEIEADLKTLTILIESHWKFDVSSRAADDLNIKKWNKTTIVPLANDLKVLKEHLCNTAKQSTAKLIQSNDVQAFNDLVETIYCRVILLNRRRPGEMQRVLLSSYENNDENKYGSNKYEEFDKILTTTEKILVKTLKRIVIRGKRGRGVPVLFSTDVQNDLATLIGLRSQYVPKDNKYLFSKAGGTGLCGYKVLEKHAKMSGAKNPKSLTATRLRKHLATLTQLFDMSESEMEQLATFMGHTMSVHKQNYRLPSDVFQTAKISKLLLLMEDGKADIYHGKTLDEIDLNLDEDIAGEEIQNDELQDLAVDHYMIFEETAGEERQIHMEPVEQAHSSVAVATKNVNKKRVFTNNVKEHNHQDTISESTKKKKRVLIPWTTEQKQVVTNYFSNNIKNKKPPKRNECETLKELYSDLLENKDWLKIKVFIQNIYTNKTK